MKKAMRNGINKLLSVSWISILRMVNTPRMVTGRGHHPLDNHFFRTVTNPSLAQSTSIGQSQSLEH